MITRRLILATAVLVLSACTSLMLANLDWLISRYIESYIELSAEQRLLLSELVDRNGQKMAENSSKRAEDFLDTVIALNQSQQLADQTEALASEVEDIGRAFIDDNAVGLTEFALSIKPEQLEPLRDELIERNTRYRKKYVEPSAAERKKDLEKDILKSAKKWFGRLDDSQKKAIARFVGEYPLDDELWLSSRQSWQNELLSALSQPSGAEKSTRLETVIRNPDAFYSPEYLTASEVNRKQSVKLLSTLLATSNDAQRERVDGELRKLKKRLRLLRDSLAADAPT